MRTIVLFLTVLATLPAVFAQNADHDPPPAERVAPAETPEREAPDAKVRLGVFARKLFSIQAFYETVPGTAFDQSRNFPKQWGRGGTGLAKRFGSQYGQFVLSEIIVGAVSAAHREDPRYFPSKDHGIWKRTRHALGSAFWVPKAGRPGHTFAISLPAGVFGSWAIATRWSPPDLQTPGKILEWGGVGLGFKVGGNVLHEFWPDVKRHIFHRKHTDDESGVTAWIPR